MDKKSGYGEIYETEERTRTQFRYISNDGFCYTFKGQFANDKKNGPGFESRRKGFEFYGNYVDDEKHGLFKQYLTCEVRKQTYLISTQTYNLGNEIGISKFYDLGTGKL